MKKLFFAVALLCSFSAFAQIDDPDGNPDESEISTPLDGGVSLLAVAGAGYAIKKVRDINRSRNKQAED